MNEQNIPQKVNIAWDQLHEVICESCKGEVFTEGVMLREVSTLITGASEPQLAPIPVFICLNCKEVLQKYLPPKFRKPKITPAS